MQKSTQVRNLPLNEFLQSEHPCITSTGDDRRDHLGCGRNGRASGELVAL